MAKKARKYRFIFEDEAESVHGGKEHSVAEYEVIADCRVAGELDFEHFRIGMWDFDDPGPGVERSLYLRAASLHYQPGDLETGDKDGYFHGGGAGDELVALVSLATRRRFRVGSRVRMNDRPVRMRRRTQIHPQLFQQGANVADALPVIQDATRLRPECKLAFMLAALLYSQGLQQIEDQPQLALIAFVSALETLSADWRLVDGGPGPLPEDLQRLVDQIGDVPLRGKLHRELWAWGCIKRKFVEFVLDHVEREFWDDPSRPNEQWARIPEGDLRRHVERLYGERCAFLHRGAAPPPCSLPRLAPRRSVRAWARNRAGRPGIVAITFPISRLSSSW